MTSGISVSVVVFPRRSGATLVAEISNDEQRCDRCGTTGRVLRKRTKMTFDQGLHGGGTNDRAHAEVACSDPPTARRGAGGYLRSAVPRGELLCGMEHRHTGGGGAYPERYRTDARRRAPPASCRMQRRFK